MKYRMFITLIALLTNHILFSQISEQESLNSKVNEIQFQTKKLQKLLKESKAEISILKSDMALKDSVINEYAGKIKLLSDTLQLFQSRFNSFEQSNSKEVGEFKSSFSLKIIITFVLLVIVTIVAGYLNFQIIKRQNEDKSHISNLIKNLKIDFYQELSQYDVKLLDVIRKQLQIGENAIRTEQLIDHSFHKNSANEIQRIANYVNTLDPKSQEAVALLGSLNRIKNYFNANDYEITDFTGKDFDERIPMKVKETFYEEILPKDTEIISRTLKPQIKYKGQVIQQAEVITKYNN